MPRRGSFDAHHPYGRQWLRRTANHLASVAAPRTAIPLGGTVDTVGTKDTVGAVGTADEAEAAGTAGVAPPLLTFT